MLLLCTNFHYMYLSGEWFDGKKIETNQNQLAFKTKKTTTTTKTYENQLTNKCLCNVVEIMNINSFVNWPCWYGCPLQILLMYTMGGCSGSDVIVHGIYGHEPFGSAGSGEGINSIWYYCTSFQYQIRATFFYKWTFGRRHCVANQSSLDDPNRDFSNLARVVCGVEEMCSGHLLWRNG